MKFRTIAWSSLAITVSSPAAAQPTEIPVARDYMSTGFFFSSSADFYRGDENPSGRSANRVSSATIAGVTGENAYFEFDFDGLGFTAPVQQAFFRVEVVGGFFTDPTPGNPTEVSLHSLSADPLDVVDDTISSGPGSWREFRDNEITVSSIASTTSVTGLGVFDWDITDLVNEWIANGDSNIAYSIAASTLLDTDFEPAAAFVNSTWSGLTNEVTARIVIPAPASALLLGLTGLAATRRRR
ncbi:MAG: hypothetical protein AAGB48_11290 [Planctomycetota bacterium]